jgi:hypothetical protein
MLAGTATLIAVPNDAQARPRNSASTHHAQKNADKRAIDDQASEEKGNTARETAVIYSQPNISQTAYPTLPSKDRQYRYPNSLNPDQLQSPTIILVPPNDGTSAQVLINGKIHNK